MGKPTIDRSPSINVVKVIDEMLEVYAESCEGFECTIAKDEDYADACDDCKYNTQDTLVFLNLFVERNIITKEAAMIYILEHGKKE